MGEFAHLQDYEDEMTMDIAECRAKAQAYLDAITATPNFVWVQAKNLRVEIPRPRFEIIETRETPDCVLFSYDAAGDPRTGEREELGGNLPLSVDRSTGQVDTAPMQVLADFWPSSIGPDRADAFKTGPKAL